jgi:hypothetical protein
MAIDRFAQPPLRHVGKFTSSGTFVIPANQNKIFVTVTGARGGRSNQSGGAASGAAISSGGFIEVNGGSTLAVVIGAGGASALNDGATGGTTTFDGAITVTSSAGGNYNQQQGAQHAGASGSRSDVSTLPVGYPTGAVARVTGATTTGPNGEINDAGSGIVNIYA